MGRWVNGSARLLTRADQVGDQNRYRFVPELVGLDGHQRDAAVLQPPVVAGPERQGEGDRGADGHHPEVTDGPVVIGVGSAPGPVGDRRSPATATASRAATAWGPSARTVTVMLSQKSPDRLSVTGAACTVNAATAGRR